jgi:TM2 domain-containing membrane protein YozV
MYSVVGNDGQVYGPVDMTTLRLWIAEGRIAPTTELIDPLDGRRIPASMAPALHDLFPMAQTGVYYPRPGVTFATPPKSKLTAALLAFFLGSFGVHRFYLGHVGSGIALIGLTILGFITCGFTLIIPAVWVLVDFILILTGGLREANGQALE